MKPSRRLKEWHFFLSSGGCGEKRSPRRAQRGGKRRRRNRCEFIGEKKGFVASNFVLASDAIRCKSFYCAVPVPKTGMGVTAKTLPDCKRGKEENAAAPVCTTIKDHNNDFLQRKVDLSFEHCLETLQSQGSERVFRLQVVCPSFAVELQRKVILALLKAGLHVFGIQAASEPERTPVGKALAALSVIVALNEIERAMKKLGYAVHHGEVFKKNPAAKFTFEHSCTVKKFPSILSNNERIKDVIVPHFSKLESMLADPECEFTRPIRINYDLIEVSIGWYFSISKRQFVEHPVKKCETPRAFIKYEHTKVPDVRYIQKKGRKQPDPS